MTQEERYLFDLMGYLVIEQVLNADELAELNAEMERRKVFEEERPKREETPHWNPLKMHIGPLLDWGEPVRRLISHPTVLTYLKELIGEKMRLDHEYAIFMKQGAQELGLHGGGAPYDPAQYYHYRNERMYNGLTVVSFALTDCGAGAGGFCCIPGSHKSNVPLPSDFRSLKKQGLWLIQPPLKAGDVLIFTEALTHGTMPWKAAHERRSLLFKYSPGHLAWGRANRTADERMDETQRRLLEPPYVYQRVEVVEKSQEP